jgi:hypothetical protein
MEGMSLRGVTSDWNHVLYSYPPCSRRPTHTRATKAPDLLFYCIEHQEIMTLGKLPYTMEQVISNALCLLMASQIFPLRELDMWEYTTIKTYPALKTFIHEAYSCNLNSTR